MRRRKRLYLPWVLSSQHVAPAGRPVYARDANWVEDDGYIREGWNTRYEYLGRHSHWQWGNPTHWRRPTPADVRARKAYWAEYHREE